MTNEHNTAPAVETRGLAFAYPVGSGEPAFEISWPDLRIDQGAFCVVVGSTGSGKTTLLRFVEARACACERISRLGTRFGLCCKWGRRAGRANVYGA